MIYGSWWNQQNRKLRLFGSMSRFLPADSYSVASFFSPSGCLSKHVNVLHHLPFLKIDSENNVTEGFFLYLHNGIDDGGLLNEQTEVKRVIFSDYSNKTSLVSIRKHLFPSFPRRRESRAYGVINLRNNIEWSEKARNIGIFNSFNMVGNFYTSKPWIPAYAGMTAGESLRMLTSLTNNVYGAVFSVASKFQIKRNLTFTLGAAAGSQILAQSIEGSEYGNNVRIINKRGTNFVNTTAISLFNALFSRVLTDCWFETFIKNRHLRALNQQNSATDRSVTSTAAEHSIAAIQQHDNQTYCLLGNEFLNTSGTQAVDIAEMKLTPFQRALEGKVRHDNRHESIGVNHYNGLTESTTSVNKISTTVGEVYIQNSKFTDEVLDAPFFSQLNGIQLTQTTFSAESISIGDSVISSGYSSVTATANKDFRGKLFTFSSIVTPQMNTSGPAFWGLQVSLGAALYGFDIKRLDVQPVCLRNDALILDSPVSQSPQTINRSVLNSNSHQNDYLNSGSLQSTQIVKQLQHNGLVETGNRNVVFRVTSNKHHLIPGTESFLGTTTKIYLSDRERERRSNLRDLSVVTDERKLGYYFSDKVNPAGVNNDDSSHNISKANYQRIHSDKTRWIKKIIRNSTNAQQYFSDVKMFDKSTYWETNYSGNDTLFSDNYDLDQSAVLPQTDINNNLAQSNIYTDLYNDNWDTALHNDHRQLSESISLGGDRAVVNSILSSRKYSAVLDFTQLKHNTAPRVNRDLFPMGNVSYKKSSQQTSDSFSSLYSIESSDKRYLIPDRENHLSADKNDYAIASGDNHYLLLESEKRLGTTTNRYLFEGDSKQPFRMNQISVFAGAIGERDSRSIGINYVSFSRDDRADKIGITNNRRIHIDEDRWIKQTTRNQANVQHYFTDVNVFDKSTRWGNEPPGNRIVFDGSYDLTQSVALPQTDVNNNGSGAVFCNDVYNDKWGTVLHNDRSHLVNATNRCLSISGDNLVLQNRKNQPLSSFTAVVRSSSLAPQMSSDQTQKTIQPEGQLVAKNILNSVYRSHQKHNHQVNTLQKAVKDISTKLNAIEQNHRRDLSSVVRELTTINHHVKKANAGRVRVSSTPLYDTF
jgi:hypothetical protein